jgi:hypothetical protein
MGEASPRRLRIPQVRSVPIVLAQPTWKVQGFMRAPIPAEERTPRVSRVIAEALVRRQGPRRIVTRATRLGLSPTLTRALVVACGASALDADGIPARPRKSA